jgi:hypothetical protein
MKLYKGKKRLAMRMMSARHRDLMQWALSIRPGDYIATCEGCNRKVAKIDFIEWRNEGWWSLRRPNKTWFIGEIDFLDTHGRLHACPGGGCAYPAETPEQVTNYFRESILDPGAEEQIRFWFGKDQAAIDKALAHNQKFKDAFKSGKSIVDNHGELLPEFDSH